MFDLEPVNAIGEKLTNQFSELLEMDLSVESMVQLYFAGLGKIRADLYLTTLFYGREGDRCREAGAYFSACLMTSSAIESLLAVLCLTSQEDVERIPAYKKFRGEGSYEERVLNADFQSYIDVASELGWIPSDFVSSELLDAAIKDFPLMAANLFPTLSEENRRQQLEAFKKNPGIEMLRLLQHMRNLVHGARWVRLRIRIETRSMEADSKFIYVIAFQVMYCLIQTFTNIATAGIEKATALKGALPPEVWKVVREQVESIARSQRSK